MPQLPDPEVPYQAQNYIFLLLIASLIHTPANPHTKCGSDRSPSVSWDFDVYLSSKRHQTMLWSHKAWLYLSLSLQPEQHTTELCDVTVLFRFWWHINIKFLWDLGSKWVRWHNKKYRAHSAAALRRVNMCNSNENLWN